MLLKPRKDLQLRKVGCQHIIVSVREGSLNMSDVFSLNETAACLWKRMCEGDFTVEQLAGWMCEEYAVDKSVAVADIERQLEDWKRHGLLE